MLAIERQEQIKNKLIVEKNVYVAELSEYYDVSFETIRRDLKELEKTGLAKRTYGGAVLVDKVKNNADYKYLSNIMVDVKQNIARAAMHYIHPMDCIYIDFSTTCGQLAGMLGEFPINVMTSSLDVMNILSEKENVSLICVGGEWDKDNRAFQGKTAVETISQFHLDKAFISCRAISMDYGISDKSSMESEMRKAIINSSNQVYLMVDHSKFNKMAFVKTDTFDRISTVITDTEPSEEWRQFFKEHNIDYFATDSQSK